ncbi:hypothetical protein L210DRAFT_3629854 [Boletus edulis BED1]|uniref:Uncharacterized protein n=1 Tax=Boletus edulis BED1 TaxID=1328754 RepID=A0AAD4BXU9_BOLED|nr:hypothetical protein L210DRAFT_3629854 [Boletus edulis BED1]
MFGNVFHNDNSARVKVFVRRVSKRFVHEGIDVNTYEQDRDTWTWASESDEREYFERMIKTYNAPLWNVTRTKPDVDSVKEGWFFASHPETRSRPRDTVTVPRIIETGIVFASGTPSGVDIFQTRPVECDQAESARSRTVLRFLKQRGHITWFADDGKSCSVILSHGEENGHLGPTSTHDLGHTRHPRPHPHRTNGYRPQVSMLGPILPPLHHVQHVGSFLNYVVLSDMDLSCICQWRPGGGSAPRTSSPDPETGQIDYDHCAAEMSWVDLQVLLARRPSLPEKNVVSNLGRLLLADSQKRLRIPLAERKKKFRSYRSSGQAHTWHVMVFNRSPSVFPVRFLAQTRRTLVTKLKTYGAPRASLSTPGLTVHVHNDHAPVDMATLFSDGARNQRDQAIQGLGESGRQWWYMDLRVSRFQPHHNWGGARHATTCIGRAIALNVKDLDARTRILPIVPYGYVW